MCLGLSTDATCGRSLVRELDVDLFLRTDGQIERRNPQGAGTGLQSLRRRVRRLLLTALGGRAGVLQQQPGNVV
jgi:hypothetical protein